MDILKRKLAPVSDEAWREIDNRAKDVLKTLLSARKVVHVEGPKGWDYSAVPEGRLTLKSSKSAKDTDIKTGVYRVKPLVEARINFELDKWELDNIERGARDINLDALEDAAKKMALFEENAIYNGYKEGDIQGLSQAAVHTLKFGGSASEIMASISEARFVLMNAFVEKPYALVVGKEAFKRLNAIFEGYPLIEAVKGLIGGDVILTEALDGALLVPYDHEDIEMTVGQDFSIGYSSHDDTKVKFFITESFTFRVLDERILVKFEL
jgi:uncharacterized linocin/CFP29 family protein